jgi:hypothetical protein
MVFTLALTAVMSVQAVCAPPAYLKKKDYTSTVEQLYTAVFTDPKRCNDTGCEVIDEISIIESSLSSHRSPLKD